MKKPLLLFLSLIIIGTLSYLAFNESDSDKNLISMDFRQVDFKPENSKKTNNPDEFTRYFKEITTKFGKDNNNYPINYRVNELNKAKSKAKKNGVKASTAVWIQRGPANVGGRTRGIIVDPDDPTNNTWFAGAATGGVWKTTDRGATWTCLTDDLPILSANTLAMAGSNHDVIYAGTGESFPGGTYLIGSGIFKSTNRGTSWNQLASTTTSDFTYVNRLVVDPSDANVVIAATEKGIMKSSDGGSSWNKVYTSTAGIEDLDADPNDFTKIYATENGIGVIKSIDAGSSWTLSSEGISSARRIELAISPVNTAKIYISVNTNETPDVYRSTDYGATWLKFKDTDGSADDFLGGQGEYDNIITAHPYNEDIAFLGGVNLYKVDFSTPGTITETDPAVLRVDQINTQSFIYFQPFTNANFESILGIGNEMDNGVTSTDFVSVEIRFGNGMSQKAHRFTVGGAGPGVPSTSYIYNDYVDVPFEVWDVTNSKQLMVSFRDQEEDGVFDLEHVDEIDDTKAREYIFVSAIDYNPTTPNSDMITNGGHEHKQIYFLWPRLASGATWDVSNLPDSKVSITYGSITEQTGTSYVVTNAYGGGVNIYNQSAGFGNTVIPGVHPDHHNLVMVKTDEANQKFIVINGNDGGLAISENEGVTFTQLPNNYITTQFYGVAKKPGANEYIGGMQDNGTWATPNRVNSSVNTNFIFHIGGDGFECTWHPGDDKKIIGSVYYNSFRKTVDRGNSWVRANTGIQNVIVSGEQRLDGPFITRISSNRRDPDVLFAVGYNGIYKSTNFATTWAKKTLGTGWNSANNIAGFYVSSQHNVEVSIANEKIVWAGAAMNKSNGWGIFVSTDQGETFSTVSDFTGADLSGYISGIATHPFEDSTAYITFSFAEETKVIRTKDLGQTWEDISGYNGNTESSNGFPDVVTNCLIVMPHDPSILWVGTDIGIFESIDDGLSWQYLVSDLPAVSVYDMFVQDGQVVVATHGRGIWTASFEELNYIPELIADYEGFGTIKANITVIDAVDSIKVYLNETLINVDKTIASGLNIYSIPLAIDGEYKVHAESFKDGIKYNSNSSNITISFDPTINLEKVLGKNSAEVTSTFIEEYDSVQLFIDNSYHSTIISPASGEFTETIELTVTGNYSCYIDAYIDGTVYKSNEKYLSFIYVGINITNSVKTLKVYPNPTRGYVTIDLPENFNKNYSIDVYNLSGAKVYSTQINKSDNRINLEELNDGLYILKIESNGEVYSQKIQLRK